MHDSQRIQANRPFDFSMLKQVELFREISESALHAFAEGLSAEAFQTGAVIVEEGDTTSEMWVVLHGELEVTKRTRTGSDVRIAMLGPGGWFGEMAVLGVFPRSASIRAVAPSRLVRIPAAHLEAKLRQTDLEAYSIFVTNVAGELSRRLRVADGIVANLQSVSEEYIVKRGKLSAG